MKRAEISKTIKSIEFSLIENSPFGYYVINTQGKYLYVNKQGARLAKRKQKEMVGRTVSQLFPKAATLPFGKAAAQVLKDKKKQHIESYYPDFNTWFENTIFPIPEGICIVAREIPITRQTELQIANATALIQSSDDAIMSIDTDGIITGWNYAAEHLYKYHAREIIGKPVSILMPLNKKDDFPKIIKQLQAGKKIHHYETQRITKLGKIIDILLSVSPIKNAQGKVIGASKIARDITNEKRIERLLVASEKRAKQLLYSSIIGVFISDFDGTILEANDAYLKLTGYTKSDLKNKLIQRDKLTPPEYSVTSKQAVQALQAKGYSKPYEKVYIRKDGKRIDVLIAVTRIEKTHTCIGFVVDITKQKDVEKNLQRSEENFKFLSEASKILSSSLDYRTTLANVTNAAIPYIADWCSIEMLTEDGKLESLAISHKDPKQVAWARKLRQQNPPHMQDTSGAPQVIKTGKAEIYPYVDEKIITASVRNEQSRQILKKLAITSVIIAPIKLKEKTIGAISFIITHDRRRYDTNDLAMANEIAKRAAIAIENAALYKRLQEELEERKKTEQENAYLSTLLDYTNDAIIISELKGKIIYWNKGAAQLYGYSQQEAISKTTRELLRTIRSIPREQMYQSLEKTNNLQEEIQHITKNNQKITIESKKTVTSGENGKKYILEINRDITGRREIENALRQSEERLQLALEVGKIGVWDWDIETDTTIWTKQMYRIHGFETIEDLRAEDLDKLIYPDDREKVEKERKQALKKQNQLTLMYRIITPSGDTRYLMTHALIRRNKFGKPIRMVGAVVDITEQKNLEQDKNDFISIATHELKTPVTSLKAYAEVLERKFLKGGDQFSSTQMGKMNAQLDKLTSLIADLLDATKIEAGKLAMREEVFAFDDLVKEITEELQRTTDRHTLAIQGATAQKVYADKERIGQVITNLISNAIKYSPQAHRVNIILTKSSSRVQLCVQDFGVGIPKSKQKHVFERFYRVSGPKEKTFPGLGLGLYISSEIIKRQRGKIWVESESGKGSKFCFSLPISKL